MRRYRIQNVSWKGVNIPQAECQIAWVMLDSNGVTVCPQWYAIDGEQMHPVQGENFSFPFVAGPVDIEDLVQQAFLVRFPNAVRMV